MSFQLIALPESQFAHYFAMDEAELKKHNARKQIADVSPCYPCRVSLEDAKVGESMLLINYQHQSELSAYQASHAIFVRENQVEAKPASNEIPKVIRQRLISVRAFDQAHEIIEADVVDGRDLDGLIDSLFENPAVSYLHLHYAKPGCFAARVVRAH